jgi:hypothetical protein
MDFLYYIKEGGIKMRIDDFKVGDRVWCLVYGWGKITQIDYSEDYPITVKFDNFSVTYYTVDGKLSDSTKNRSLFFEEITANVFNGFRR